jgi:hypothetical protein
VKGSSHALLAWKGKTQKANQDCVSGQYFNLELGEYEAGIPFT